MTIDLKTKEGKLVHYNDEAIKKPKEELESLVENEKNLKTLKFAKKVILPFEIKYNNSIEGINSDISTIEKEIKSKNSSKDINEIINLYKGYKYILQGKEINKETLKELYSILSKDLLDEFNLERTGDYYRTAPVYILRDNNFLYNPYTGVDEKELENYMNSLFNYINSDTPSSEIDVFLKSQIIHFYFVYIHPYMDVNGRTSRTVAMWYLLNNNNYPYLIFNRAISFTKSKYYKTLSKARDTSSITDYLQYIFVSVEKELLINNIDKNVGLTGEEAEMLEYLLSMNGNYTLKDLINMYNSYSNKAKSITVYEKRIEPLIKKDIINLDRETNKHITPDLKNFTISLNPDIIDIDKKKIKNLNIVR